MTSSFTYDVTESMSFTLRQQPRVIVAVFFSKYAQHYGYVVQRWIDELHDS
jgi:hypothetical protein